jgi:16S rRNA U516 pseudouridylate synthase RsuA-like enzyme
MLGHRVHRLIRVRIGPVHLGELQPGEWRHLKGHELGELSRSRSR